MKRRDFVVRAGTLALVPYREQFVRLGPSFVTDENDVDVAIRALRDLS